MRRRQVLIAVVPMTGAAWATPAIAASSRLPPECRWLPGRWRSDVEPTMAHFTLRGLAPAPQHRARIADLFGRMTHTFTPTRFVAEQVLDTGTIRIESGYRVSRFTSSSVTLVFPDAPEPMPETTLYRSGDRYAVRSGDNFEYFRRID